MLAFSPGCDVGPRATDPAYGPPLRVVSRSPANGEGADCAVSDVACGVPTNTRIRLRFDRALLPTTAVRQAIRVYTGTPVNGAPLTAPQYDVLSSELTFTFQGDLSPGSLYQVELLTEPGGDSVLRAFDGAPLPSDELATRWSFLTARRREPALDAPADARTGTCDEVVPVLTERCGSACCHGGETPAMGLRLVSRDDVRRATNRVAHQTETSGVLGTPFDDPSRFGVGMAIIDPNRAHSSYLVYKLLLDPRNLAPCDGGASCATFLDLPGADGCRRFGADEERRIAEWFVQGEPMPLDRGCDGAAPPSRLDCATLRAITSWIESGAQCD